MTQGISELHTSLEEQLKNMQSFFNKADKLWEWHNQTEQRLDIIEGNIDILENAHLNYVDSDPAEFKDKHGSKPDEISRTVGKNEDSPTPIEKRALKLAFEMAEVLTELTSQEDAASNTLAEGIVEQLAWTVRMKVVDPEE